MVAWKWRPFSFDTLVRLLSAVLLILVVIWCYLLLTNFFGEFFPWTFKSFFDETNFLTYNLLTIASFRIGVPSILFVRRFRNRKNMWLDLELWANNTIANMFRKYVRHCLLYDRFWHVHSIRPPIESTFVDDLLLQYSQSQ